MPPASAASERRKALRSFKQRGYVVHVDALEAVLRAFRSSEHNELSAFLEAVFEHLSRPGVTHDSIVSANVASEVLGRIACQEPQVDGDAVGATIEVIDAFKVPRWRPHAKSAGVQHIESERGIAGAPNAKAMMFRFRYQLVQAKTLRNARFTRPASGLLAHSRAAAYLQLTGIESLPGTHDDRFVLGMLTQLEEGKWYLEDEHGNVRIDLSEAAITSGLHTECSFVIAQGRYDDGGDDHEPVFRVSAMGTPPLERREESLAAVGKASNLFGGSFDNTDLPTLLAKERQSSDAIVILSDFHLDSARVIAGFRHILEGYAEDGLVPAVMVLMGSFLSHPFGQYSDDIELLETKFSQFGQMIAKEMPQVAAETMFVFVPGMNDPGPGNVLPRPSLPAVVTKGFTAAIGEARVHYGSNPCRMRYMTQELVFYREDLMHLMVRNCCVRPDMSESTTMSEHLVKSVVDQAHLSPLPLTVRPTIWNFDHALWLFPTPHLLVLADKVESYVCKYGGALGLNPGSFASHFSFLVYLPAERKAQQSAIASEHKDEPLSPLLSSDDDSDVGDDSDSGHSMLSLLGRRRRQQPQGETGPEITDSDDDVVEKDP